MDTHQLAGIADSSAKRYRAAAANVADFLVKNFPDAEGGEDLDDALMEWKHMMRPSKTDFEVAIATVEFTLPHVKGQLHWCKAALHGWQTAHVPNHTTPLSRSLARLFAIQFVGLGHWRLAVALMIQRELGARPSEVLQLMKEDVSLPEYRLDSSGEMAILAWGVRSGTKAKREQASMLRDPFLVGF